MREEVKSWWEQAEADLRTAAHTLEAGDYYAAAFFSQQAAEKALKALHLHTLRRPYIGHPLVPLAAALGAPPPVLAACSELTGQYTISRYPDAAMGTPARNYNRPSAEHYLRLAEEVVAWAGKRLPS